METLWAIWTKLSIFTPSAIKVDPRVALSTDELEPISTLFPIIALPIWGVLIYSPILLGANPKPSEPITQFECKIQFEPTDELS